MTNSTPSPRVLVVSRYSSEPTVRPEAEIMLRLAERGIAVTVITDEESAYTARFRAAGIDVLIGHPGPRRDPDARALLRSQLEFGDYHCLLLYNSRAIANGVVVAQDFPKVQVIVYRGYAGDLRWYDPSVYSKIYHPRVDVVLCNNVGVQQHIRANRWYSRRDRTVVIEKGHDLGWYAQVERGDRGRIGLSEDLALVAAVTNDAKFKGTRYLLQSMLEVDERLGIHLALFGQGLDQAQYRQLAVKAPDPRRIVFAGFQPKVLPLVRASDLLVLASIKGESLTKAVIEAMALGTPVLVTDIPGNLDLVEHGKSGWVVPPRDPKAMARAMEMLILDEGLRSRLAEGAHERIKTFLSHDRTVDRMERLLRGLSTRGRKPWRPPAALLEG